MKLKVLRCHMLLFLVTRNYYINYEYNLIWRYIYIYHRQYEYVFMVNIFQAISFKVYVDGTHPHVL